MLTEHEKKFGKLVAEGFIKTGEALTEANKQINYLKTRLEKAEEKIKMLENPFSMFDHSK